MEVLEDITLRLDTPPWFVSMFKHAHTHNMVLKQGSILRFAPGTGAKAMKEPVMQGVNR